MGYLRAFAVLLFLGLTGLSAAEKRPPIGANLNGLSYYSTQLPFWNDNFPATAYARKRGLALALSTGPTPRR